MFISEILVYFRKENNTKLDGLTAFIKLGDELILKRGGNIIIQLLTSLANIVS